ncbi:RNA polymerase sigma-70 factor [Spirosoma sp.]|uniref:RNA polymerase sigma factor n=1 Tax=Spirosoma sp. TaxID=1899569 RepID=UPI0026027EF3|nr:RNA polymerase sigma-70 factor [Spirosoma sp.]MCX6218541.1 RNA polymerase sigma-70 factor [Spirosoma sp.]
MIFPNESLLLAQLSAGDEKAFGKLYAFYHPSICRFIIRYIESADVANDICQEVFIKIWEDRHKLLDIKSFSAYLFAVTRNHTFNFLRRAAVENRIKTYVSSNYCLSKNDTEESLQLKEYQQFLQTTLDTLPPQSRTVFRLCRQQEKSYEEAAQILGISSNAIKKHMVKSMKVIRFAVKKDIGLAFSVLMEIVFDVSDVLLIA